MSVIDDFLNPIAGLFATLTGAPKEQVLEVLKGIIYLIGLIIALVIGWRIFRWISGGRK